MVERSRLEAVLASLGLDVRLTVPELARAASEPEEVRSACRTLFKLARRGFDISAARAALAQAMSHSLHRVRHNASQALSMDMQRSGEEDRLYPKLDLAPGPEWYLSASYRRIYALDDQPLAEDPVDGWPYDPHRPCLVCREVNTCCIWHWRCMDLTGSTEMYEYRCASCGKYSLYDYSR